MKYKTKDGHEVGPLYEKNRIYFQKYAKSMNGTMNWIPELFQKDPTKDFYTLLGRDGGIVFTHKQLIEDGYIPLEEVK